MACPAKILTATMWWPSIRPLPKPCVALARARAPRCWSATPIAPVPTPKAWKTSPIAPATKSKSGRVFAQSSSFRRKLIEDGLVAEAELTAIEEEVARIVAEAHALVRTRAYPDASTAAEHVFDETPAVKLPPEVRPDAQATPTGREVTYMQATLEALTEEMARNPRPST